MNETQALQTNKRNTTQKKTEYMKTKEQKKTEYMKAKRSSSGGERENLIITLVREMPG